MSTTGRDFIVIGENIHATRVLLQKSERISANEEGEEAIVFKDEDGATLHLRIPEEEKRSLTRRAVSGMSGLPCRLPWRGSSPIARLPFAI